jgi:hypothetical protein
MSAVVVRARFDSETVESIDPWEVRKGDLGVLKWKSHRRHPRFFEPHVVWDRDPQRRVRKVIVSSIAIVGLQTSGSRVLLLRSPR